MNHTRPGVLRALLVAVAVILLAVWAMVALSVNDPLWLLPVFSADAAYVDLYWDGELVHVGLASPGYELLNEALQADLPHVQSYSVGTGLSEITIENLRASGRLLEAHYAQPVRVHSRYLFGASEVLYIPLSGYHASGKRVFNSARGTPLELQDIDEILAAAGAVARQEGLIEP